MTEESTAPTAVAELDRQEEHISPPAEVMEQYLQERSRGTIQEPSEVELRRFGQPTETYDPWQLRGFQDAMKGASETPPWVIEGLLLEQSATLVSAHPHSMKSLSWLQACLEAVFHGKVWGHFAAPKVKSALFIETEDSTWLVEARIRGLAKGLKIDERDPVPGFHYLCIGPFDLEEEESRLHDLVKEHGLNLIVLSTLQNLLEGKNWSSQQDMAPIMAMMIRLARVSPVVVLTHSPQDKKQKRAAGTITQAANFLTTVHFEKRFDSASGETFVHARVDSKAGAGRSDFTLGLETAGSDSDPGSVRRVIYTGSGLKKGLKKQEVLAALEANPEASTQEIADLVEASPRYVQQLKREMKPTKAA